MDATAKADQPGPSAASADDMLAQLAGEEIDRLLAEAEAGNPLPGLTPNAPAAPPHEPSASANDSTSTIQSDAPAAAEPSANDDGSPAPQTAPDVVAANSANAVDPPAASAPAEAAAPPASAPVPDAPADAESQLDSLSANLDQLLNSAEADSGPPPPAPEPPKEEPAASEPPTTTTPAAQAAAPPPATAAKAPAPAPAPAEAPSLISPEALAAEDVRPPSFLMRFVDVCLAPLEAIPDGLRDAMGKVAIVTLVNALAALVYVAIKHHRHH